MYCKSLKCNLLSLVLLSHLKCIICCYCYCCCCLNFIWVGCGSSSGNSSKGSYLVYWSECNINQSIFISFNCFYESTWNKEYITLSWIEFVPKYFECSEFSTEFWIRSRGGKLISDPLRRLSVISLKTK